MRLCAIYNVWSDYDLLIHSVNNVHPLVDGVLIICSENSNYGEYCKQYPYWEEDVFYNTNVRTFGFEPESYLKPIQNETNKRNFGLDIARQQGYTHFIMMDADEFYDPAEFRKAKERFHVEKDLKGLVVESQVYFGSPELTIGNDTTLVPFIHELTPTIKHEFNRKYPFAWIDGKIRIDPTRSLNIDSGIKMADCLMHHYSWVRKDYSKKIRNSTARANLERSTIMQDLLHAKEGYYCEFYQKHLVRVPNRFGIPDYGVFSDKDLQSGGSPVSPGNEAN
ncbi:MAG TPA: hypothetical protein VGK59_11650 [Ohtaekwangia sp.]